VQALVLTPRGRARIRHHAHDLIHRMPAFEKIIPTTVANKARSFALSPDGCYLACGMLHIVQVKHTATLVSAIELTVQHDVLRLAFSPTHLACMCENHICLFARESWSLQASFTAQPSETWKCFCLAPDGQQLVAGSQSGDLCFWGSPSSLAPTATVATDRGAVRALACCTSALLVASGHQYGAVVLWTIDGGRLVASLEDHAGEILDLGFSRDGARLVSCSTDGSAHLVDVASRACVATYTSERGGWINSVSFSRNGALVAIVFDKSAEVRVFRTDASAFAPVSVLSLDDPWRVRFSRGNAQDFVYISLFSSEQIVRIAL